MSEWLSKEYYGNTVLDYLICFGIILLAVIGAKILYWLSQNVLKKFTSKTKTKIDDIIVDKLEEPLVFGLVLGVAWYAVNQLNYELSELRPSDIKEGVTEMYSRSRHFVNHLFAFLVAINITWLVIRLIDAIIEEYVIPIAERSDTSLDDQLMPVIRKGFKLVFWSIGLVVALDNAGYNVGAIIAGLGIGGLAFALAAQDTIKNFFGGIMIFADRPFKMGERIKINGVDGFVKEIGIRSTRVQTLEGRIITIPNSHFSDNMVENIDLEPSRKVVLNLGLVYETSAIQMQLAIQTLRDIAKKHNDILEDEVLISFNAFNDFSLGILFIYYIRKDEDYLQTQSIVNLDILSEFNAKGLEMAFPTQTLHISK